MPFSIQLALISYETILCYGTLIAVIRRNEESNMKQPECKCIYTGKDDSQAHFVNQEHIIPACIGGMKRLPKGYVSDEANALFSGLVVKLARNSPVTLMRMFVGPGKRGSHNPKRRGGASKMISVMKSNERDNYRLGYICMGKPIHIDQIHIVRIADNQRRVEVGFDRGSVQEDAFYDKVREMIGLLKTYAGDAIVLREEDMGADEILVGYESGKWYVAAAPGESDAALKEEVYTELSRFVSSYESQLESVQLGTVCTSDEHVTANMQQMIDINAYFRVTAKIAFNCLAELRGCEYVMQRKFDAIRKAILTGEGIDQVVFMQGQKDNHMDVLDKIDDAKAFGRWRHTILVCPVPGGLVANVMLYGTVSPMTLVLSQEDCSEFGEMDGLVCDWENRRELRFAEYLVEAMHPGG